MSSPSLLSKLSINNNRPRTNCFFSGSPSPVDAWLDDVENYLRPLLFPDNSNKRRVPSKPRVKVAILDTGFDPTNPLIIAHYSRRAGFQDFTTSDPFSPACDASGHGTHGLALIHRIACHADVYVARVGRTMHDLSENAVVKVSSHRALAPSNSNETGDQSRSTCLEGGRHFHVFQLP